MTKWVLITLAGLTLALLGAACAPRGSASPSLTGTVWQLTSLNGAEPVPGTTVTAVFQEDGNVTGSSGCNGYGASYTVTGSSIEIGPPMGTLMACDEPIMTQESTYLRLLQGATRYEIKGDALTLTDPDGSTIVFAAQSQDLAGSSWTVISYNNGKGGAVSVILGTEMTADFGQDGRITGSSGCNTYFADYKTDGDKISIGEPGATRMACSDPEGVMDQESEYLTALTTAATYSIQGNRMEFRTASGSLAVSFQQAAP